MFRLLDLAQRTVERAEVTAAERLDAGVVFTIKRGHIRRATGSLSGS